jgi:hypothetical protein
LERFQTNQHNKQPQHFHPPCQTLAESMQMEELPQPPLAQAALAEPQPPRALLLPRLPLRLVCRMLLKGLHLRPLQAL